MAKYWVPKNILYLLRWRFDFGNNKPSRFGMWMSAHGRAWAINKDGLIHAAIEGKNVYTREIKILAACDGHEFVNFKWHALIQHAGLGGGGAYPGVPIGMILQTRSQDVLILADGKTSQKQRTEQDKNFHYAGFGK